MADTADNKLVYTGQDPIVWNRVNKLRLEQGLPGLADIGLPRPANDSKSYSPYSQYTPTTNAAAGSGSKFTFNFGGENFTVNAPAGTTEAQARAIFDQQASTGSLTGLKSGQTLDAAKQFAGGLLTAASQLNVSQLASGLSGLTSGIGGGIGSALGAVTRFTGGTTGGITSALGAASRLTGVPIKNPMNVADFVKVGVGSTKEIGALSSTQVQGLLGQAAASTGQSVNAYSLDKGIGQYGINPAQLEQTGYLKPGTLAQYTKNAQVTQADIDEAQRVNASGGSTTPELIASNRKIKEVLNVGGVWTGKGGVSNLTSLVGDSTKQLSVQSNIMETGYNSLQKAGVITSGTAKDAIGGLVQAAGKVGAALTAAWSKGTAPAGAVDSINNLAKQGLTAVNFTDFKLPAGASGEQVATGVTNTVNRRVLNQSVVAFIGDAKVPVIDYGQPVPPPVPTPIAEAPQTPTTITDSIFDSFTNKYWASTATFYPVSGTINIIINSGSGAVVYSGLAPEVQARIQQDRKADIVQDAANQKFYDDLLAVIAAQINRLKATSNNQVNTV
jgi:hypothetical protein